MQVKKISRWIAIAAGLMILCILGSTYYLSHNYLHFSRHTAYEARPIDYGMKHYDIDFESRSDNIALKGWFIPAVEIANSKREDQEKAPVIIIVHGHQANMGRIESINQLRDAAKPLHDHGFASFSIDLRNHGQSADSFPVAMGLREHNDVLGALDFLQANAQELGISADRIGIWSNSMGASTSIHATAEDKRTGSPQVKALFADSGYASPINPIYLRLSRDGIPAIIQNLITFWVRMIPDFDIFEFSPLQELAFVEAPIYFVHARKDTIVKAEDSIAMYDFFKARHPEIPAELWISTASEHVKTAEEYPEEYQKRLLDFFSKYL